MRTNSQGDFLGMGQSHWMMFTGGHPSHRGTRRAVPNVVLAHGFAGLPGCGRKGQCAGCVTTEFFLPFDPTRLQTLFGIFARLQDDGEHTDGLRISGGKVGRSRRYVCVA